MNLFESFNLSLKIDFSELNKLISIDHKVEFITKSINSTLDTYLNYCTTHIQNETKKQVITTKPRYELWVDLTGEDEYVTRKKSANLPQQIPETLKQVLNREHIKLKLNLENELNSLKTSLHASKSFGTRNENKNIEELFDFDSFFKKIDDFMKTENFCFEQQKNPKGNKIIRVAF
jgi:hypothetical protein